MRKMILLLAACCLCLAGCYGFSFSGNPGLTEEAYLARQQTIRDIKTRAEDFSETSPFSLLPDLLLLKEEAEKYPELAEQTAALGKLAQYLDACKAEVDEIRTSVAALEGNPEKAVAEGLLLRLLAVRREDAPLLSAERAILEQMIARPEVPPQVSESARIRLVVEELRQSGKLPVRRKNAVETLLADIAALPNAMQEELSSEREALAQMLLQIAESEQEILKFRLYCSVLFCIPEEELDGDALSAIRDWLAWASGMPAEDLSDSSQQVMRLRELEQHLSKNFER